MMLEAPRLEPPLEGLAAFVQERLARARPGHGWEHVERVCRLAAWLAEQAGARTEIVLPAALLHDVGRTEEDEIGIDHAEAGATVARQVLPAWGYAPAQVEEIAQCILAHRFSGDPPPTLLEAQVLSDADKLDAVGAVGIARTFLHSGAEGRSLEGSLPHFYDKLLRLGEHLYTDPARRLATGRIAYMRGFLERLMAEQKGSDWENGLATVGQ